MWVCALETKFKHVVKCCKTTYRCPVFSRNGGVNLGLVLAKNLHIAIINILFSDQLIKS